MQPFELGKRNEPTPLAEPTPRTPRPIVVRLADGTQDTYPDEGDVSFSYVPRGDGYLIVIRREMLVSRQEWGFVTEAAYGPGSWHRVTGGDSLGIARNEMEAVEVLFTQQYRDDVRDP